MQIPASDGTPEYDSYVHLAVGGQWVMVLRDMPQDITAEQRQKMARYSSPRRKASIARDLGAKGIIFVTGPTSKAFSEAKILVSNNMIIITLDDNSTIYSDIKIPENFSASIKKGLPVEVKLTSYKDKIFEGEVDFVSSRINADTRSLLSRIKVKNKDLELISGSLLEVGVKFNLRNSLSVPDTSVMIEGDKSYVYKINKENIANKTEIKTGIRTDKSIEIISGLTEGDIIVAEGLKKVRPRGTIKPINK
mgnify:CR=1 FL=1